jgi:hypothetical protein
VTRRSVSKIQEDKMQPKPAHGAAPGFRVLNENAASAVVQRHARVSLASFAGECDAIRRRSDRTIDVDLYRRRIAASRREVRGSAALTSAWAGVLAMIGIYLALFFAAEQTRTSNRSHAAVPMVAMPNAPDILF